MACNADMARELKLGDVQEADIVDLAHDGRGIARIDGKAVFVDGALPGERVRLRVFKRRRQMDEAGLVATDPRPQRDRRRVGVVITEAGRALLEAITARRRTWVAEQLTALSAEERAAVDVAVAALERIVSEQSSSRRVGRVAVDTD